jgi:hypothetical protein
MGMVGSDNTAEQQKRDGTAGIGGGLTRAADVINAAMKRGFAVHNAKDTKEASYAAELGAQLASHAKGL